MKATQVAVVTPTARERFAAARPMIIIVVFSLLLVIAASILPAAGYNNAPVGIRNKEGDGARALAQVLGDHGISVRDVNAQQAASVDENTTLVVIFPSRMTEEMAKAIETRTNVVYVGLEEDQGSYSVYLQGLRSSRKYSSKTWLTPGCTSDIASRTQHLQASDYVLSGTADGWNLCFSDDGRNYAYAERSDSGRFRALIPDSLRLRNRAISEGGNAALAINAIGRTPKVAWYSPTRTDTPTGTSTQELLTSPYLMPAFLMVIAACLLAGLARGRPAYLRAPPRRGPGLRDAYRQGPPHAFPARLRARRAGTAQLHSLAHRDRPGRCAHRRPGSPHSRDGTARSARLALLRPPVGSAPNLRKGAHPPRQ